MSQQEGLALIIEVHRAVHAFGLAITDTVGLSQAEALVLVLLYERDSVALDEVHRTFLHRRSTLTNVLERLERRRLVQRRKNATDGRRFDLSLTAAGKHTATQIVSLFSEILASSGISEREAAESRRTLATIIAAAL